MIYNDTKVYLYNTFIMFQIENLLELVQIEQNIYNIVFHELIRQVSVECAERGQLLAKIRSASQFYLCFSFGFSLESDLTSSSTCPGRGTWLYLTVSHGRWRVCTQKP